MAIVLFSCAITLFSLFFPNKVHPADLLMLTEDFYQ